MMSVPQELGRAICWHDLAVTSGAQVLLHAHSGEVGAGRLLGVLGPSGAGKSTLIHALAGLPPSRAQLGGRVWAESRRGNEGIAVVHDVGLVDGTAALLEQDDAFFSELTVRETIEFAAELAGQSPAAATRNAERLLRQMSLAGVADRKVGEHRNHDAAETGSSKVTSGERRRLAVACALAGEEDEDSNKDGQLRWGPSARVLLADEPTTGLDAFQAARVVGLLQQLSVMRKCATIVTLHQPRASIWRMLDDVLLLAPGGHVVYCGPTQDILPHFDACGHRCPREGINPAEFLIDLVSVNSEELESAAKDRERVADLALAFQAAAPSPGTAHGSIPSQPLSQESGFAASAPSPPRRGSSISPWRAFRLLLRRSLRQNFRDRGTNVLRLLASCGLALVFTAHFGQLDGGGLPSARSVASRVCLLSFGVIAMAMLATARALDRFSKEAAVVARERAAGSYSGCIYLASKALTELPSDAASAGLFAAIVQRQCGLRSDAANVAGAMALLAACCAALGLAVGAAAPRGERALAVGAPIMIVHMLTGVIDPAGQSAQQPLAVMRALRGLSPIRHAIEALCISELGGMRLARNAADAPRMGGLALVRSGDEVLRRLEIVGTFEGGLLRLAALTALHLAIAAVALVAARPRSSRGTAGTATAPNGGSRWARWRRRSVGMQGGTAWVQVCRPAGVPGP